MKQLTAQEQTVRAVLSNRKYHIDYYQREYRWESKHVTELLNDLMGQFEASYDPVDSRLAVKHYERYFLGPIILSALDDGNYLIDGQQRLTTLTLLLVALDRRLAQSGVNSPLMPLISSEQYGHHSFTIDIEERQQVMEALLVGHEHIPSDDDSESVTNIVARFDDVAEHLEEISDERLPYFTDWLIDNVYLAVITASTDSDAYTIFETMNDRGLSLSPAEMLKGYLLSQIEPLELRDSAHNKWRSTISSLSDLGREEDADAIKAWLRAQHARTTRDRRQGAEPRDFERIGSEFHRWVRDNQKQLELNSTDSFYNLIDQDITYFLSRYLMLREAARTLTPGLESVRYLEVHNFTLQYPVLLAALSVDDDDIDANKKLRVVGSFLDILLHRRLWNQRSYNQSAMRTQMFSLIQEIRGKSAEELATLLRSRLEDGDESFTSNPEFRMHGRNKKQIRSVLARFTDYLGLHSGELSRFDEYLNTKAKGYDIEHILLEEYPGTGSGFETKEAYAQSRSLIGGLLLLPRSVNRSLKDLAYEAKLEKYAQQNRLASSLHVNTYKNDPQFTRYIEQTGLPLRPLSEFGPCELEERQELYTLLAEEIWHPKRVEDAVTL